MRGFVTVCRVVLVSALCGWAVSVACPVCAELVDAVVATVDKEVILHSDLVGEAGPALMDLQKSGLSKDVAQAKAQEILKGALDQAIEQRILYREAQLAGVEITDDEIESRLDKIKKQYDSSEAFTKALTESGETLSDVRERLRKQIMAVSMGMHKRKTFEQEAVISEAEMRQYYQDHIAEYKRPERVLVSRIFLTAEKSPAARAAAKAKLETLREELAMGADFAALAKAHSQGPEASEGGRVGWVMQGDFIPELEKAAFALSTGQVSAPVESEFGYTVLKVDDRQEAGMASYEEVRTEIEPLLRAKYADEHFKKWMSELRKRSQVRILL